MAKGGTKTTTQTQALDPKSQAYVDNLRRAALGGADALNAAGPFYLGPDPRTPAEQAKAFMDPYLSSVVDATRGEFDYLRGQAGREATDAAIQSGAYGGSRHGVAEGVRKAALDRAQTSQIANLFQSGYQSALQQGLQYSEYQRALRERQAQEPLMRQQALLQLLNLGMGPTGGTSTATEKTPGSLGGTLGGLGLLGLSLWNPFAGAAAGALMTPGDQRSAIPAGFDPTRY